MVCFLANCALKYIMIAFSVFNFSYRDYCCGFPKNNETKQSYVSGKITYRMADSIAKHPMLRSTFAKLIFWPWHISSKFLFNKASALEAILRVALFRLLAPPNERRYLSSSTKSVETCSKSLSNSLFMESCKNWLNRRMFLNQSTHFFLSFWANLGLNVLRDKIHISQKVYSFLTLFFMGGGGAEIFWRSHCETRVRFQTTWGGGGEWLPYMILKGFWAALVKKTIFTNHAAHLHQQEATPSFQIMLFDFFSC